ncbi:MAG: Fpg/Nei family DNA glycosylase [Promicromonosporaceae bacterium]|nr:Fpg/Nei family DNA glycosylase [Promicromonosporaceae bacterium]
MPEADEVRLTAERLGLALAALPLERAELRWPSCATVNLVGATVTESTSYGKHLLTRLDDGRTLHTHLRMDGSWRIARTGTPSARAGQPQVRAVLGTARWTAIGELLGMMDVIPTSQEKRLLAGLGPEVLAPDFEQVGLPEAVRRLRAHPDLCLAQALLEQRIVAGIGTIWMAESLFTERLYPWLRVAEVDDNTAASLIWRAAELIRGSIEVARTDGLGAVSRHMHGRHRRPCPRCGRPVQVASQWGPSVPPDQGAQNRIVFWCPACQAAGR